MTERMEAWVKIDKLMTLSPDHRKKLKKSERGFVTGLGQTTLLYEYDDSNAEILDRVRCNLKELKP
jgi:hypothetical protein